MTVRGRIYRCLLSCLGLGRSITAVPSFGRGNAVIERGGIPEKGQVKDGYYWLAGQERGSRVKDNFKLSFSMII